MRIVIDMQGAQTESRFRGIGRYTMSITKAIARNRGKHVVILALSGLFPDTIEPIRVAFDGLLPQKNILLWNAPSVQLEQGPIHDNNREIIEHLRAAFIASLKPDVVFMPDLPLNLMGNSSSNIGDFIPGIPAVIVVHDQYINIQDEMPESSILTRSQYIECLKRASICVAASSISSLDLAGCLGVDEKNIIQGNIDASDKIHKKRYDDEALRLLEAFNNLVKFERPNHDLHQNVTRRPRLAYISPLPPDQTGIADYSVELLPQLARYYDTEVIVAEPHVSDVWVKSVCPVRTVSWFKSNAHRFDRILYHFGNSPFHSPMFELLDNFHGVVVLHDFFLGDIHFYREMYEGIPNAYSNALYESHGYGALLEKLSFADAAHNIVAKYPCSFDVIRQSFGVIVHSHHAKNLAGVWYEKGIRDKFSVIPLLRIQGNAVCKSDARNRLGLIENVFIAAAFGGLGAHKLNKELIEAFVSSSMAADSRCILLFVGEMTSSAYGEEVMKMIASSGLQDRIVLTGRVSANEYKDYLASVDVAIQLRQGSRGETSAAALDCMNYGLATIVNANGSMEELPSDCVSKVSGDFSIGELAISLNKLWLDADLRKVLGLNAKKYIKMNHDPASCAKKYFEAIENFYSPEFLIDESLIKSVSKLITRQHDQSYLESLATAISNNIPDQQPKDHTLFIDVSTICQDDLKTGIQRVVRTLMFEMIKSFHNSYRIEPIYLTDKGGCWHFRYANKYTLNSIGVQHSCGFDEPVVFRTDDLILGADLTGGILTEAHRCGLYQGLKNLGVRLYFVVYDLLPIELPEMFPQGANESHEKWIRAISEIADGAVAISRSVADSLSKWLKKKPSKRLVPLNISWFHLGADLENSIPTYGIPDDADTILQALREQTSFLMVGTIEPRKGYDQTLTSFEQLWAARFKVNLVIVGKVGWQELPDEESGTIPKIANRLRNHPELSKRLFWLEGISDEYLEKVYAASSCLIVASEGEGFGLPLIEAAKHSLPIIARDIPVFLEVAGEHAFYFNGKEPKTLSDAIKFWLALKAEGKEPRSEKIPWLTWKESTEQLLQIIIPEQKLMRAAKDFL